MLFGQKAVGIGWCMHLSLYTAINPGTMKMTAAPASTQQDPQMQLHAVRQAGLGNLSALTDELLAYILFYLDLKDLLSASSASRLLRVMCCEEALWLALCMRTTRPGAKITYQANWRQTVLTQHRPTSATAEAIAAALKPPAAVLGFTSMFLYRRWYRCNVNVSDFEPAQPSVPYADANRMSPQTFAKRYDVPCMPCVLQHAMDAWPMEAWRWEALQQTHGDVVIKASCPTGSGVTMTLNDYCSYSQRQADEDPLYCFDSGFGTAMPQLLEQYNVPRVFDKDYLALLDDSLRPDYQWLVMGPARCGASWHVDPQLTSAWNALLSGRKRWALYPPHIRPPGVRLIAVSDDEMAQLPTDTLTSLQWWLEVYPNLSPEQKPVFEFVQRPGEVVFVPGGWWHAVLNLEPSVAVTQNYVSDANFARVMRYCVHGSLHYYACVEAEDGSGESSSGVAAADGNGASDSNSSNDGGSSDWEEVDESEADMAAVAASVPPATAVSCCGLRDVESVFAYYTEQAVAAWEQCLDSGSRGSSSRSVASSTGSLPPRTGHDSSRPDCGAHDCAVIASAHALAGLSVHGAVQGAASLPNRIVLGHDYGFNMTVHIQVASSTNGEAGGHASMQAGACAGQALSLMSMQQVLDADTAKPNNESTCSSSISSAPSSTVDTDSCEPQACAAGFASGQSAVCEGRHSPDVTPAFAATVTTGTHVGSKLRLADGQENAQLDELLPISGWARTPWLGPWLRALWVQQPDLHSVVQSLLSMDLQVTVWRKVLQQFRAALAATTPNHLPQPSAPPAPLAHEGGAETLELFPLSGSTCLVFFLQEGFALKLYEHPDAVLCRMMRDLEAFAWQMAAADPALTSSMVRISAAGTLHLTPALTHGPSACTVAHGDVSATRAAQQDAGVASVSASTAALSKSTEFLLSTQLQGSKCWMDALPTLTDAEAVHAAAALGAAVARLHMLPLQVLDSPCITEQSSSPAVLQALGLQSPTLVVTPPATAPGLALERPCVRAAAHSRSTTSAEAAAPPSLAAATPTTAWPALLQAGHAVWHNREGDIWLSGYGTVHVADADEDDVRPSTSSDVEVPNVDASYKQAQSTAAAAVVDAAAAASAGAVADVDTPWSSNASANSVTCAAATLGVHGTADCKLTAAPVALLDVPVASAWWPFIQHLRKRRALAVEDLLGSGLLDESARAAVEAYLPSDPACLLGINTINFVDPATTGNSSPSSTTSSHSMAHKGCTDLSTEEHENTIGTSAPLAVSKAVPLCLPRLVHGDVTARNVHIQRSTWMPVAAPAGTSSPVEDVAGATGIEVTLLDFADAGHGDPLYDFISMRKSCLRSKPELSTAMWAAYKSIGNVDNIWPARLGMSRSYCAMCYCLLHEEGITMKGLSPAHVQAWEKGDLHMFAAAMWGFLDE